MQNRRSFFKALTSFALALPFATGPAARAAAAPAAAVSVAQDFTIVNGWVLTRADLAALGRDDL